MQMLGSKNDSNEGGYAQSSNPQPQTSSYSNQQNDYRQPSVQPSDNIPDINIDEDEIPF